MLSRNGKGLQSVKVFSKIAKGLQSVKVLSSTVPEKPQKVGPKRRAERVDPFAFLTSIVVKHQKKLKGDPLGENF